MKIERHAQAKILSSDDISQMFSTGLKTARDPPSGRASLRALFGVCLYTGTRIAEACSLHTQDVYTIDGSVRPRVTILRSGVPLKVIQKISGHKTKSSLQKYLEVLDEDLEAAISTLKF